MVPCMERMLRTGLQGLGYSLTTSNQHEICVYAKGEDYLTSAYCKVLIPLPDMSGSGPSWGQDA